MRLVVLKTLPVGGGVKAEKGVREGRGAAIQVLAERKHGLAWAAAAGLLGKG